VIEAIEELDPDAFYASSRADGHGRTPRVLRGGSVTHDVRAPAPVPVLAGEVFAPDEIVA
jgi:hypothetical protein